jgi:hypothetical protein
LSHIRDGRGECEYSHFTGAESRDVCLARWVVVRGALWLWEPRASDKGILNIQIIEEGDRRDTGKLEMDASKLESLNDMRE